MTKKLERYDALCAVLECEVEGSFVSDPVDKILGGDLRLLQKGEVLRGPAIHHPEARDQECHAVTALAWLQDPSITIYVGMAYYDCMGAWNYHSFATKDDTIIEPTPLMRDSYFGTPMPDKWILDFVSGELDNIRNFGVDPMPLWKERSKNLLEMLHLQADASGKGFADLEKLEYRVKVKLDHFHSKTSEKNAINI